MDKENNNNDELKSFKKQLINFGIVCILMAPIIILVGISLAKSNAVEKEIEKSKNSTIYDKAYMADNFEVLSQDIEEINSQIDKMIIDIEQLKKEDSKYTIEDMAIATSEGKLLPCIKCESEDLALEFNDDTHQYHITCNSCLYTSAEFDFPEDCISNWNYSHNNIAK